MFGVKKDKEPPPSVQDASDRVRFLAPFFFPIWVWPPYSSRGLIWMLVVKSELKRQSPSAQKKGVGRRRRDGIPIANGGCRRDLEESGVVCRVSRKDAGVHGF